MKNLIFINGTMGVGKTTISNELTKLLPKNVFLDGDWCWNMNPFVVTDETKEMVLGNISYLLNSFIKCSEYENIIFCWVMDEESIIDSVLSRLELNNCLVKKFSLIASEDALVKRIKKDVCNGIRDMDCIQRSIDRTNKYNSLNTEKIDVSSISPIEAAKVIISKV